MTAPLRTALALVEPCPPWCVRCDTPDPGVVDHYSEPRTGKDYYDNATWSVLITQRVTAEGAEPARVIIGDAPGTYASVDGFTRALLLAGALMTATNAALPRAVK